MDYREHAIDELQKYASNLTAVKIITEELQDIEARMVSVGGGGETSNRGGGNKTEEKWLNLLANAADEELRLKEVKKRIKRVETALKALSTDDARILKLIYVDELRMEKVATMMHTSRATAYRMRDDALIRFTRSLYGAVVT
jgi:DNA-directed RNA polymerase specialized sigma24 family protein